MTVDRINKLDIDNRPLFTGVYGYSYGQEFYVEQNLNKYNFWQELYRYLRHQHYTTLFYNREYNFFAYEESQLETFFFKTPDQIRAEAANSQQYQQNLHNVHEIKEQPSLRAKRFTARIASPNSKNRINGIRLHTQEEAKATIVGQSTQNAASGNSDQPVRVMPSNIGSDGNELVSHRPGSILVRKTETDCFFQLRQREEVLDRVFKFMDANPGHKLAVVFVMPSEISFDDPSSGRMVEDGWISNLQSRYAAQLHTTTRLRIIVIYDTFDVKALNDSFNTLHHRFFFKHWFHDQLFPMYREGQTDLYHPSNALFYVDRIGRDEIANVLKRRRIIEGLQHTLWPIPFEDIVTRIWQQFIIKDPNNPNKEIEIDTVAKLMSDKLLPKDLFEAELQKMDNDKAMDKLRRLSGIDGIIHQFENYLADFRACRDTGEKFRKHMVFMGNPGTGKTTVARIFADVLREEGLLENGRLHQVTVGDLVAGYVGQTRIKTQEVCQKASGGVLFIDEAYGLYQSQGVEGNGGGGGNSFGQEAIEVLLQFMENDDKSLVILAGYPEPIKDLLVNGNAGFNSRIGEQGRFMFEDYTPDTLLKIALAKLKGKEVTDKFRHKLNGIFAALYRFKDKDWANARTAENIISKITSYYRANHLSGPYDIDAIPDDLMRLVKILTPEEEATLLEKLHNMVGLRKVKAELQGLFDNAKSSRRRMEVLGEYNQQLPDLTFLFEGNPGTGKTSVARLMGEILAGYGLIKSPQVLEYNKDKIVSSVKGGTAKRVSEMFDACIGKVLFIDEAYRLADDDAKDAVDQIVANMTLPKYRGKMAIVLAGYPGDMARLMNVNSGLERRFTYRVPFEDYTNEELAQMFENFVDKRDRILAEGCRDRIIGWFGSQKRGSKFANAGLVERLYNEVNARFGHRISSSLSLDRDFLRTYIPEDFPESLKSHNKTDEEILRELDNMIGLRKVKESLNELISTVKVDKILKERNMQSVSTNKKLNFVFKGNPGTGKTTVARLLGNILANYGLIDDAEVLTYTKGSIVDGVVGGSSRNVEKMFESAKGKVLFIDEAYQLADNESKDALDAITNMMTDSRFAGQLAIILAGYPGDMAQLIDSNPGLKSRFNYDIFFEDYSNEELFQIFDLKVNSLGFTMHPDCQNYAIAYFASLKRDRKFGNGREAENLTEKVKALHSLRMKQLIADGIEMTDDVLMTIMPEDFPTFGKVNAEKYAKKQSTPTDKLRKLVGIDNIKEKFEDYVRMLKFVRQNPQTDIPFRPHMAFMGNPGTGKTTVASLFGQILLSEGLLPNSNFVKVSPTDLIGQYVGQTGPKTRAQCERARGGILFVDEAYQLCPRHQNTGDYGKEAITELIQFMEEDNESIVILAGYTEDIKWLIENGNAGLKSRIPEENYFFFEDYQPEVLLRMLVSKLSDFEVTEKYQETMAAILDKMFEQRDANWGNARVVENIQADAIRRCLKLHFESKVIDVDCIDDKYFKYL